MTGLSGWVSSTVLDLASADVEMKKSGSKEYKGPCPSCGGTNRFVVRPHVAPEKGGRYFCRDGKGCGKSGDSVQYCRDFRGMTYTQAAAYVGFSVEADTVRRFQSPMPPSQRKKADVIKTREYPHPPEVFDADLWREHALKFAELCNRQLLRDADMMAYLDRRGIDAEAVKKFLVGYNPAVAYRKYKSWGHENNGEKTNIWLPGPAIVIPAFRGSKIMRLRFRRMGKLKKDEAKYIACKGSRHGAYVLWPKRRVFVITESELDAIACVSKCPHVGAVGLGNAQIYPDKYADDVMRGAMQVLDTLDADEAGGARKDLFATEYDAKRWVPPEPYKDAGELAEKGGDLNVWLLAGIPPGYRVRLLGPGDEEAERRPEPGVDSGSYWSALVALFRAQGIELHIEGQKMTVTAGSWENVTEAGEDLVELLRGLSNNIMTFNVGA